MKRCIQPYQIAVTVGVTLCVLLIIAGAISPFLHICHVCRSGYSLFIGDGILEYGYGWGWIRRRMFHVGGPDMGWSIRRPLPPLVGVTPATPSVHVPVWLCVGAILGLTVIIYRRKRIFDPPPHRHLKMILLWGGLELVAAILVTPLTGAPRIVMVTIAFSTVIVPLGVVRYLDSRVVPPGFCRKCRYNLTDNVSGRCPECGTPIPRAEEDPPVNGPSSHQSNLIISEKKNQGDVLENSPRDD